MSFSGFRQPTMRHAKPTAGPTPFVKVRLPAEAWGSEVGERVWAEELTADRARIRNVPFFAYGISFDDVLKVRKGRNGLVAAGVVIRSGHSTYRFFVQESLVETALQDYWRPLEKFGCSYERATEKLFAVDVPPEVSVIAVYQALEVGEEAGVWEFEEGHCGHPR